MSQTNRVRIGGDYWSAQLEVFDALDSGDYDLVVFRVGYAGGKTITGCDWIHQTAVQIPESDSLVMAPDYAKGGPATYKTFFDRLPGENTVPAKGGDPENSPIVDEYNAVDKRLTYVNASVARLGSADKWNRYAGSEFNAIYCDEPAHYDTTDLYNLVEMLTSRQRTHAGPNVMLWTSTGAGFNDYYDITEQQVAADGESDLPWRDRMRVIVGDSRNNPFLPEDAQEKLRRQFEGTDRESQALAGGFAAPTGLVYPDFSRERHVVGPDSPNQVPPMGDDWRAYGYDHGWSDPRVVLEAGQTEYGQLVVLDEFYREGVEYRKAVEWLTANDRPEGVVYAEHEPEHQRAFQRAGYRCDPAVKDLDEGIPAVRDRLDWRDDPKDRPGLLVHERCVNTIRELQDYQEEEVGTAGAVDHACFVAGTAVTTPDGERPIESIRRGDMVLTRDGYRPVVTAGQTDTDAEVVRVHLSNGRTLTGTPDHPVFTTGGLKELDTLRYGEVLYSTETYQSLWQKSMPLSTMESRSGATRSQTTTPTGGITGRVAPTSRTALKPSTGRCGKTTTARSRTANSFTTRTATPRITTSRIWNVLRQKNTPADTPTWETPIPNTSGGSSNWRKSGTGPRRGGSGTDSTGRNHSARRSTKRKKSATSAASRLSTIAHKTLGGSAQMRARRPRDGNGETTMWSESVPSADPSSSSTSTPIPKPVRVRAVERCSRGRNVYNLDVADRSEYVAEGVLVHNCDALRYLVMGVDDPGPRAGGAVIA